MKRGLEVAIQIVSFHKVSNQDRGSEHIYRFVWVHLPKHGGRVVEVTLPIKYQLPMFHQL